MPRSSLIKAVTAGAMLWAPVAGASSHRVLPDQLSAEASSRDTKKASKLQKPAQLKRTTRMFELLKPVDSKLPDTARRDATAGVFI